jgi:hypothetical protein
VRTVKPVPALNNYIERQLSFKPALYPYVQREMRMLTVAQGMSTIGSLIWEGQKPQRLTICFVSQTAYNGDYESNPLRFYHYSLSSMHLDVDGVAIPSSQPYIFNYPSKDYCLTYMLNLHNMGVRLEDGGFYGDYNSVEDYSIYVFQLSPLEMGVNEPYLTERSFGSVRLVADFAMPLPEPIVVLILGESAKYLQIDSERNVKVL